VPILESETSAYAMYYTSTQRAQAVLDAKIDIHDHDPTVMVSGRRPFGEMVHNGTMVPDVATPKSQAVSAAPGVDVDSPRAAGTPCYPSPSGTVAGPRVPVLGSAKQRWYPTSKAIPPTPTGGNRPHRPTEEKSAKEPLPKKETTRVDARSGHHGRPSDPGDAPVQRQPSVITSILALMCLVVMAVISGMVGWLA